MTPPAHPEDLDLVAMISALNRDVVDILHKNLGEVEKISQLTECLHLKLAHLYDRTFPKQCQTCSRRYETIEEYRQETAGTTPLGTRYYDGHGVAEFRNCPCGSTLMVLTESRRDESQYGMRRRALFEESLRLLSKNAGFSGETEEVVRDRLRKVFRSFSITSN